MPIDAKTAVKTIQDDQQSKMNLLSIEKEKNMAEAYEDQANAENDAYDEGVWNESSENANRQPGRYSSMPRSPIKQEGQRLGMGDALKENVTLKLGRFRNNDVDAHPEMAYQS